MSLNKSQEKDLELLGEYFRKIEKLAVAKNIDLDVFMSEYTEKGISIYATEKVALADKAGKRKKIFEKAGKSKTAKAGKVA